MTFLKEITLSRHIAFLLEIIWNMKKANFCFLAKH